MKSISGSVKYNPDGELFPAGGDKIAMIASTSQIPAQPQVSRKSLIRVVKIFFVELCLQTKDFPSLCPRRNHTMQPGRIPDAVRPR